MEITITISDEDVLCLKNDLLDVEQWVKDAVNGKIHHCRKRMLSEWIPRLMKDPSLTSIPTDESQLLERIFSREDYKDRLTKEQEVKE